jgi:hypothetical protein
MGAMEYSLCSGQKWLESELLFFFYFCKVGTVGMKSSSFFIITLSILLYQTAFAQMSTRPSPKDIEADKKSSFQKFHDRLRIGFFSVITAPTLYDIEKGNYQYAAASREFSTYDRNRDSAGLNLWNQLSFNYNFGAKMNFVVNPRFSLWPVRGEDTTQNPDNSFIIMEDTLIGFQGVPFSSQDKKFNFWVRPGIRLPNSRGSRNSGNGGFGTTTNNIEIAYYPSYDFNKTWQVGIFGQFRQWVFEDRLNYTRFRFYTAPYVQYTMNDTTRFQAYYESIIDNPRRWRSNGNKKSPVFKDLWQNIFVGVSHDVTPKFNIFPFLGCFTDNKGLTSKDFWLGAWISYQIK